MVRLVTETELRAAVGFDAFALREVEKGYRWMQEREMSMPPVFHIDIDPQSAVDVKGAYVKGIDFFAIKMASGFYDNPAKGLASSSSVILVLSAHTGFCKAVFMDNGYLMNLRTSLAGAVATDHLARRQISTVGIIGTGVQARDQLHALTLVRDFDHVLVWGRDVDRAQACAADMRAQTQAEVTVGTDLADVVSQSDVLVTTTPSMSPLIKAEWVAKGTHIVAMGSDLPGKQELSVPLMARADQVVSDSIAQCDVGGELQHVAHGDLKRPPVSLPEVIGGTADGRRSDDDITICDMTGLGVLDTAISVAALQRLTGS
ncbi:MAG: ornithine cyclodeaminase family protein [Roseobacter sp.]|jgi:ornithine cyclodeaminase|nr:ornithine cyclodeaminase family protein [Roseobacter sp.]